MVEIAGFNGAAEGVFKTAGRCIGVGDRHAGVGHWRRIVNHSVGHSSNDKELEQKIAKETKHADIH